jgi:maltooligosyltrehalose synthase
VFLEGQYVPLALEVPVAAGALAFARIAEGTPNEAVLFITPRLFSRVVSDDKPVPLGGDCWKTSRLMLPPQLRDRVFRDAITGAEIRPASSGDSGWIFLGEAFQTLPIAILRTDF